MPDALTLLPVRLLLTVPVAACSCLLLGLVFAALRIREPWLRVGLVALALLDVLAVVVGLPTGGFVFARIVLDPEIAVEALRPVSGVGLLVWMALALLSAGVDRVRRRRLRARVATLAAWFPAPEDVRLAVRRAAGGTAVPRVAFVPGGGSPFLVTEGGSVLVLPRAAWGAISSGAARHALLCHELAHGRPADVWMRRAGGWMRHVFAFNPFVAALVRRLLRESEALTDRAALRRGASARGLAQALVAVGGGPPAAASAGLSSSFRLARFRLHLLRQAPRRAVVVAQVLALALLLPWLPVDDRMAFDPSLSHTVAPPATGRVELGVSWAASPLGRPLMRALLSGMLPPSRPTQD